MEEQVIKRNGKKETMSFDKIARRTMLLGKNELNINYSSLSKKIIERLYDGISTSIIDELTAQQCASLATTHTDYGILASRILVSNHQKNTEDDYLSVVSQLYDYRDRAPNPQILIGVSIRLRLQAGRGNPIRVLFRYAY